MNNIDSKPKRVVHNNYEVFTSTIVSEKSNFVANNGNVVVFEVAKKATKLDVIAAAKKVFNADVKCVRFCNFRGKPKNAKGKSTVTSSYKKAYITLKEGSKIEIIEGL